MTDSTPSSMTTSHAPASDAPTADGPLPVVYDPVFVDQARVLCRLGASDVELGQAFDVSASVVRAWRTHHPAFAEACKVGEKAADERVASALFNRAVGYSYDAQELVKTKDGVDLITVTKHAPPDLASCIFWLKNRQPNAWRDKIDPSQSADEDRPMVTDEERAKATAVLLAKQAVLQGWDEAKRKGRANGQAKAHGEDRKLDA